jgi:hypothetical protein
MVYVFTNHHCFPFHGLCRHKPSKIYSNAPNPAREAGTTIIEKTNDLKRTEAREVGET